MIRCSIRRSKCLLGRFYRLLAIESAQRSRYMRGGQSVTIRCPHISVICIRLACQMCVSSHTFLAAAPHTVSSSLSVRCQILTLPFEQSERASHLVRCFATHKLARLPFGFSRIFRHLAEDLFSFDNSKSRRRRRQTSDIAFSRSRLGSRRML